MFNSLLKKSIKSLFAFQFSAGDFTLIFNVLSDSTLKNSVILDFGVIFIFR
jgi:hypothetical protein